MVVSRRDCEAVIGESQSRWSPRDLRDLPGSGPLRQMVQPDHGVSACCGKEGAIRGDRAGAHLMFCLLKNDTLLFAGSLPDPQGRVVATGDKKASFWVNAAAGDDARMPGQCP